MRFTKMEGAGNDYIYVDCFAQAVPAEPVALARRISDRHFGVGGDGLILICPSKVADARMRMFNSDGSEAEMCGNGVRCVAKFVFEHGIAAKEQLKIETGRGILTLDLDVADGRVRQVRVDMGEPVLDRARIPVALAAPTGEQGVVDVPLSRQVAWKTPAAWMEKCGLDPRMTCVSMGNPHLILYCQDVAAVPLETVGPELETQAIFPKRINVHFVQVHRNDEITMRTWERGTGITLACGTGASAVCVAGVLSKRSGHQITAHLPGGDLRLDWAADNHVYMTGPAVEVFNGEWADQ